MSETTPQSLHPNPYANPTPRLAVIADIHEMLPWPETVLAVIMENPPIRGMRRDQWDQSGRDWEGFLPKNPLIPRIRINVLL